MMKANIILYLGVLLIASSCVIDDQDNEITTPDQNFSFPETFEFKNSQTIGIQTSGLQGTVKVFMKEDGVQALLGSFSNTGDEMFFEVPTTTAEMILEFSNGINKYSKTFDISQSQHLAWKITEKETSSSRMASTSQTGCTDVLFAVENSARGFWSIDITNEEYHEFKLPLLEGGGSIACALNQEDSAVYYNVGSNLYQFDLRDSTFSIVFSSNPFNGNYPRFCYNDGVFYMSNGSTLYLVDATTNAVLNQYSISGFVNSSGGGDIAFTSDGTLYLSCFSGLYKFVSFEGTTATIERVSAENFPYQLTSMAIDRDDRIFVGTNDNNSHLIEMNKEDGSFRIVKTYDHRINDLAAWKCAAADLSDTDSDGDGIIDAIDDYPNDGEKAYDIYTPSEIGFGTLAFEDLWPTEGDYDFNDLVVNYKYVAVLNAQNQGFALNIQLKVAAAGASIENGFGIELPIDAGLIESVEGTRLTGGAIQLTNEGLEAGHTNAVIIAFDNVFTLFGGGSIINTRRDKEFLAPVELNITIKFKQPIDASLLSSDAYNPFIFVRGNRSHEIHLKDHLPTALANNSFFQTLDDASDLESGKTYVNKDNVPWAVNMIHTFRYPEEKVRIDKAYNHFVTWGQTSGIQYPDWYKDNNGYRVESKIIYAP